MINSLNILWFSKSSNSCCCFGCVQELWMLSVCPVRSNGLWVSAGAVAVWKGPPDYWGRNHEHLPALDQWGWRSVYVLLFFVILEEYTFKFFLFSFSFVMYFGFIVHNSVLFYSEEELATPPLDGIILPGVTRQSILELTTKWVRNMNNYWKSNWIFKSQSKTDVCFRKNILIAVMFSQTSAYLPLTRDLRGKDWEIIDHSKISMLNKTSKVSMLIYIS